MGHTVAYTTQALCWHKPIKQIGNGFIKLIVKIADPVGVILQGNGMEVGAAADGEMTLFTTAQPDWQPGMSYGEDTMTGDIFIIAKKKGAEILHNQKLASTYSIGDPVYKTAAGTWTHVQGDGGAAASLLGEVGIVCGPADRVTSGVLKSIVDAFTATEPVDICL